MFTRAFRVLEKDQVQDYKTEFKHVLSKGMRTWGFPELRDGMFDKAADMLVRQACAHPAYHLVLGVTEKETVVGFTYGRADLAFSMFELELWYIKEEVKDSDLFLQLFGLVEQYCKKADLHSLSFRIRSRLPVTNWRYQMFVEHFKPQTMLNALLAEEPKAEEKPVEEVATA
jgi:hypothetical protein